MVQHSHPMLSFFILDKEVVTVLKHLHYFWEKFLQHQTIPLGRKRTINWTRPSTFTFAGLLSVLSALVELDVDLQSILGPALTKCLSMGVHQQSEHLVAVSWNDTTAGLLRRRRETEKMLHIQRARENVYKKTWKTSVTCERVGKCYHLTAKCHWFVPCGNKFFLYFFFLSLGIQLL